MTTPSTVSITNKTTKYIFVTGGVVSSLGKGIVAASLGRLLRARGLSVSILKFDPYLNIDPGTMSPFQHGEVFTNLKVQDVNVELDRAKKELEGVIKNLTDKIGSTKQVLSELKTALYAKFGSKINLEEAEE